MKTNAGECAQWLFWMACLTVGNLAFLHFDCTFTFSFGFIIPELAYVHGIRGNSISALSALAIIVCFFILLWTLRVHCVKRKKWAVISGFVVIVFDLLALVETAGLERPIGLATHVAALVVFVRDIAGRSVNV